MYIYCDKEKHFVPSLVCIYRCKGKRKACCKEYKKHFDTIVAEPIDSYYLEKYGEPDYSPPNGKRNEAALNSLTPAARKAREDREKGKDSTARERARERMRKRREERRNKK